MKPFDRKGRGVGLYIRDRVDFARRPDLENDTFGWKYG